MIDYLNPHKIYTNGYIEKPKVEYPTEPPAIFMEIGKNHQCNHEGENGKE